MIFRELRATGLASAGAARRTTWRLQLRQNEFTKVKVIDRRPCISDRKNSIDKTCASATQRSGASRSGRKSSPQFISAIDAYAASTLTRLKESPSSKACPVFFPGLMPSAKLRSIADQPARASRGRGSRTLRGGTRIFSEADVGRKQVASRGSLVRELRSERESS
jgi:hypothetical protein